MYRHKAREAVVKPINYFIGKGFMIHSFSSDEITLKNESICITFITCNGDVQIKAYYEGDEYNPISELRYKPSDEIDQRELDKIAHTKERAPFGPVHIHFVNGSYDSNHHKRFIEDIRSHIANRKELKNPIMTFSIDFLREIKAMLKLYNLTDKAEDIHVYIGKEDVYTSFNDYELLIQKVCHVYAHQ